MSCDKPYWSITTGVKSGVWSTTTLNGKTYIIVDGAPTYHVDGTPLDEEPRPPLSETLEASFPASTGIVEPLFDPGSGHWGVDEMGTFPSWISDYAGHPEPMVIQKEVVKTEWADGITSLIYQMVEENDGRDDVIAENITRIDELDELVAEHVLEIYQLEGEIDTLNSKVERLEALIKNKLDKPSVAPELINAEAYIDDYLQAERKMKRNRHATKQRIQKKLTRISQVKKDSEMETKKISKGLVLLGAAVAVIGGAAMAVQFGLLGSLGL
jgi:hypothetical protein